MWIAKIGGSLQYSNQLPIWLKVFATYGADRLILVPGGGKFADEVRAAQSHWQFSDSIAHRMAILAMHQYGLLLSAFDPLFRPVTNIKQLADVVTQRQIPVWLPNPDDLDHDGIGASWDVTSDSLSAWLAAKTNAEKLILLKSVPPPMGLSFTQLANLNIIDRAFARLAAKATFSIRLYGPNDQQRFIESFSESEFAHQGR